jgi:hypothetical protein
MNLPLYIAKKPALTAVLMALALCTHSLLANEEQEYGWNDVSTSVSAPGGGQFDVNSFVGANIYYNAGITGQNTKSVVAEAGLIWNGNESLTHVTNFYSSSSAYGGTNSNLRIDRHATWVAGVLGGREVESSPQIYQKGIAYGTTLQSAAIASAWTGSAYALGFSWNYNSWTGGIYPTFNNADVVNQSYGFTDAGGNNVYTRMMDALININSKIVSVASAGNTTNANTVLSPGSGYNSITVGALGSANNFDTIASFSSRGPQTWGYRTSAGSLVTITNARAPVDIAAPGSSIMAPFYGGQSGGNNTSLSGSTNLGTATNSYSSLSGTSFAAPVVSGGIALMTSAAKTLPELSGNQEALENVVIKALLLNGATKTTGWNNGQITNSGVVTTTQSLDWATGAGRMNLATTFTNQTQGQKGVVGSSQGNLGVVESLGWDFGSINMSGTNTYLMSGLFSANTSLTGTLSWLREVTMNTSSTSTNATDIAEANLNLNIWKMNPDGSLSSLVGASQSSYNVIEHLSFSLPETGYYVLGITYTNNSFDNTGSWGTTNNQEYGIAWNSTSANSIYWQGGDWDNDSSWNTLVDGTGTSTTNSSVVVNTIFGDGTTNQSPQSTTIDGAQYTKGLSIQSDNLLLDGQNSASLNLGTNGITLETTTTGPVTISTNITINLQASQTWNNKSSESISVEGQIQGTANLTISNSSSSAVVNLKDVNNTGTLNNNGQGQVNIEGSIGSNITAVNQTGSGSMTLNGLSSYTGASSVNNGKLIVNGSISSSSLTTVTGTGSIQGTGSLGNTEIFSGGTINPGNSPGILTIEGDLTWGINGNYNWQLYDALGTLGISYDLISVTGNVNLTLLGPLPEEKFNLNLWTLAGLSPDQNGDALNFDMTQNYEWTILSAAGTISGFDSSYFNINVNPTNGTGGFDNIVNGTFSLSVQNNDIVLAYNAVPEPSTIALLLIAGSYFWARKLRKKIKFD